jgi:hypothetical protein
MVRCPAETKPLERIDLVIPIELGNQQLALDVERRALEEAREPEGTASGSVIGDAS